MAKVKKTKKKASLNTDLDDSVKRTSDDDNGKAYDDTSSYKNDSEDYTEAEPPSDLSEGDDITYTMGDIQVGDSDDDSDDEEFKKASKSVMRDSSSDEEEDEEWIVEDINTEDSDPFLDMEEDYDMDNPSGYED